MDNPTFLYNLRKIKIPISTMKASATGNDPYMINYSALDIDAIEYDKIKIKMRVNSGQEASVYFTTVSDRDWVENKVKHFPITSDNEFHTYILDMKTIKKWSDKIYQIRFDPANSQASNIEIEYIHIIPKGKPPILLALPDLCFI